jgi:hypothetical protein
MTATLPDGGVCATEKRRGDVRTAPLYGLDFADVGEDGRTLEVFFLGKAPASLTLANVVITGGRRTRDLQAVSLRVQRSADATVDDSMQVQLNRTGDSSTYWLTLVALADGRPTSTPMAGFDPLYDSVEFTFPACAPALDCKPAHVCPPPRRSSPVIDYLAKDYASFRQLMLDRMAMTLPSWGETHAADLGITLVEVLAYVADHLSYFQDAVATEAYLRTARQRISVRRHALLVDYAMHEGCNARAWVVLSTDADTQLDPKSFYFVTAYPGSPLPGVVQSADLKGVPSDAYQTFEPRVADPTQPVRLVAAHSEMRFYTWGDAECCLPVGATSATLTDAWVASSGASGDGPGGAVRALRLQAGDVLLLEEVIGPATGNPADADPAHRQFVRLTKVTTGVDPLYHPYGEGFGQPVVAIEWCTEDALTFSFCLSTRRPAPDCRALGDVSVARGNVLLVDHGVTVSESLGSVPVASTTATCATPCAPSETTVVAGRYRPTLSRAPLTRAQPLPACACAADLLVQDPREALPALTLTGTVSSAQGPTATTWSAVPDLLASGPADPRFVVETDNFGVERLRFGDGVLGRAPDPSTAFAATYRVGNGPAGNVGRETIAFLVFRSTTVVEAKIVPRNPLPATGGTAPESIDDVKTLAPHAFSQTLERAITPDDYATLAADNARRLEHEEARARPGACPGTFQPLQAARATLRWNGSGYEVLVAIDPLGAETVRDDTRAAIAAYLEPYRRIGHDVAVKLATYVPLDLALAVCVLPQYPRGQVARELLEVLGSGVRPDGTLGFFNPDNLTFGDGVYASQILAAAHAVPGVKDVLILRLARYVPGTPPPPSGATTPDDVPAAGVLVMGPFEIPRLDNQATAPDRGRITLQLRGGR